MEAGDFVRRVREFLAAVDQADASRPRALLEACARLLPRIYASGLELPEVTPTDADVSAKVARPKLDFGRHDLYFEVFDPSCEEEPVVGSLADDLGDIYVDLAEPLLAFDAGRRADAVWQWKFNVRGHCGDHIVDALRAVHRRLQGGMPVDFDPQDERR